MSHIAKHQRNIAQRSRKDLTATNVALINIIIVAASLKNSIVNKLLGNSARI